MIVKPETTPVDDLRRSKVEQARRMDPVERLLSGPELFDYACRITMAGIRRGHPAADDHQVLDILCRRLDQRDMRERREIES